jgi:hypothetical protein
VLAPAAQFAVVRRDAGRCEHDCAIRRCAYEDTAVSKFDRFVFAIRKKQLHQIRLIAVLLDGVEAGVYI